MKIEHSYIEPEDLARKHLQNLQAAGLEIRGKKVLDIGCGAGTYARLMSDMKAASVLGIDNTLKNIETARNLTGKAANISFTCGNIEEWEIKETFDLVFMRGTIYYLKSGLSDIISHLVRLLTPKGELYLTFTNCNMRARLSNLLKKAASGTPGPLQPFVRNSLAGIYHITDIILKREQGDWRIIKGKMNTVFFPLTHLTSPDEAKQVLAENGLSVREFFWGQGQNAKMTDDYGVWAVRQKPINKV